MDRKAALVGCREGHWIRTDRMRRVRLNARVRPETCIRVHQKFADPTEDAVHFFVGPGRHVLFEAEWTQVSVCDGPHEDALCLLEGGS